MRVLFVCTANPTHYFPLVPMAWALRAAGHEVRVAAPPELAETITGTGMTAVPVGVAGWHDNEDPAAAEMSTALFTDGGVDHVQHFDWSAGGHWTWERLLALENIMVPTLHDTMNNLPMIDDLVDFARGWRPDLMIRDTYTYAGGIAAHVVGAADARMIFGPDTTISAREEFLALAAKLPPEHREDTTAEWLGRVLGRFGRDFAEEVYTGHWTIDPTPPSTRLKVATRTVGVRYVPFNGPAVFPDWLRKPPERRRICLTSGLATREYGKSIFSAGDILEALADLDVEIVATVGAGEHGQIPKVPDNTRIVEFVPFHELLPTCAAVVHHGGAGTRSTAEYHGVPQVIAASGWDSVVKAERLQELGAALFVPLERATPEVLREMIVRVLGDPSFGAAATRLRDEVHAEPAPGEIVGLLEELTAEHRSHSKGQERDA
jgi:glycosyltransferase (activator-dependent family)